ncbi:stigma-specific STIG1-like protein 3 [Solanum dulcamara]|uniref:stigma-specific STIG1-like protein 3 n=1 Tax=Solanum dulcamara TaxID=45834 RepID=UPI002485DC8C|nr:stigma-specific STIG1-like protein 3 [Solanum dulcamara]
MMKLIKFMIVLAITMVLIISLLTMHKSNNPENNPGFQEDEKLSDVKVVPQVVKRMKISRFLAQQEIKNPRAADHCHKDNEICHVLDGSRNSTCCNNKCMDLGYDDHNCGACKKKCRFTETCCRGECVNLSYDKRHCGYCNNRCMTGGYCFYGMCDYA